MGEYEAGYRRWPEGRREVKAAEAAAVRLLSTPAGRRPVVLLFRNEAYVVRQLVTVAPVTTRIRRIPTEVPLGPEEGLPKPCVADLDTITTIPKQSLAQPIGLLSREKLAEVERALRFALALAGPPT